VVEVSLRIETLLFNPATAVEVSLLVPVVFGA
jgi:hypothetical protein